MRALTYFLSEAGASLWRRRRAASLAVLTIAAGLFVLGFFLVLNLNLERVIGRWSEAAEMSVFLNDEATPDEIAAIERAIDDSGLAAHRERLSKEQAAARFRDAFPDLAAASARMDGNPFPASVEVRLQPELRGAGDGVEALARSAGALSGVADVRYDRRWIARLSAAVTFVRGLGLLVVAMLAVASALTVANVIRLAAAARRDEIQIMQLVGAPLAYVRGPFLVEGLLQGGLGALVALIALGGGLAALNARYGDLATEVLGTGNIAFLPASWWLAIIAGGMLLGSVGGAIVARGVR